MNESRSYVLASVVWSSWKFMIRGRPTEKRGSMPHNVWSDVINLRTFYQSGFSYPGISVSWEEGSNLDMKIKRYNLRYCTKTYSHFSNFKQMNWSGFFSRKPKPNRVLRKRKYSIGSDRILVVWSAPKSKTQNGIAPIPPQLFRHHLESIAILTSFVH